MNVALLVGGFPSPGASGGSLTAWSVLAQLRERGHEVTVVAIRDPDEYDPSGSPREERVGRILELGAEVEHRRLTLDQPLPRPLAGTPGSPAAGVAASS